MYTYNEKERHRACGFDIDNLAYKVNIIIPTVYPDSAYVFGWAWCGGGKTFGSFSDYYDCDYVCIKVGPFKDVNIAVFKAGSLYGDGCQASVNKLGVCITERCKEEFFSRNKRPAKFQNEAPKIYRGWYE